MKILIVDDEKAGKIQEVLCEKCNIQQECFVVAVSIMTASMKMCKERFDLAIIDMKIPERDGTSAEENGGIHLVETIVESPKIIRPSLIILLSEHEKLLNQEQFEGRGLQFQTVHYDASSDAWSARLAERVNYIKLLETSPREKRDYDYDIAIITAADVEKEAVMQLSSEWLENPVLDDSTIYHKYTWTIEGRKPVKVVYAEQIQQGMVASAVLTMKMIENFAPRYIVMPGIVGSLENGYEFGDILLPKEVKEYCSGKYKQKKETGQNGKESDDFYRNFQPNLYSIPTSTDVVEFAKKDFFKELEEIQKRWYQTLKPGEKYIEYKVPSIRRRQMATGMAVMADSITAEMLIKRHDHDAEGVEMEAYGMYFAAANARKPRPVPIVMKGFSDFADKEKDDMHQKYAAFVSSQFMKIFMLKLIESQL